MTRLITSPLLLLAWVLTWPSTGSAQSATGQGDYWIETSAACPYRLEPGFSGLYYGYEHEGFAWPAAWKRETVRSAAYDIADYIPLRYDGYGGGLGNGYYVTSRDRMARWYNPEITVVCSERTLFSAFGYPIVSAESYKVVQNRGNVVPCAPGPSLDEHIQPSEYDSYSDVSVPGRVSCGFADTGGSETGTGEPTTWYEDYLGVTFQCHYSVTPDGLRVKHCEAVDE
ncbi:hypothetical protein [Longimicrobium terrae]|uniref:Uncharacterized protein n=1 Tax=Longimicrobium terrae TaxID=1639882 RepID=A0A841H5J5_9BACT|nr:hypothetical protein [Longimicrobium terrae]MBB4638917.1 hypothetical protein [Longimicrobium terrae]MBB6073156.1 hypothetical protein [Longimicrobium terrae]NNC30158.1 hypothetical protein [Longimicrobium terrae]